MKFSSVLAVGVLAGLFAVGTAQDRATQSPAGGQTDQHSQPHLKPQHKPQDMVKEMQAMNQMMVHHLGEKDPDYERRFIDMMIPHHEGAVLMAKHALQEANRPELKKLAETIIKAQEKEIEQLKSWRREWYGND